MPAPELFQKHAHSESGGSGHPAGCEEDSQALKALTHISVCICTYKRPQLLERLLQALRSQETDSQFTYSIVVADNDRSESARTVVSEFRLRTTTELVYCVEPQQNIALARNRALTHSVGDFIAFIDDDEFPGRNWLLRLFESCAEYGADGVLGPVKPYFESQPPDWIIKGKFYDRLTHHTGFIIDWTEGRTGNLLFRREILDGSANAFRSEFGAGGEDRDFFRRMIGAGRVFVWCNEAVAYEIVPPVRWTRRFMLKRALLRGKMSLNHQTGGIRSILISMAAVPLYCMALPLLFLSGQHNFMNYLIKVCDHGGRLLAFLGLNPVKETYVTE